MFRTDFVVGYVDEIHGPVHEFFTSQPETLQVNKKKTLPVFFQKKKKKKSCLAEKQANYKLRTFSVDPGLSSNFVWMVTLNFGMNEH